MFKTHHHVRAELRQNFAQPCTIDRLEQAGVSYTAYFNPLIAPRCLAL